jgi:hypothetical protein
VQSGQRRYIERLREAAAGSNEPKLKSKIEQVEAKLAELTTKKAAKTTRTRFRSIRNP